MKKVIAILTLLLTLTSCNGNTLPPQNLTPNGETVTPSGAITVVSDNLDSDVESLTQGLQTVVMSKLGAFVQNPTAIESMTTYNNADGTKTYTFTLYPDLKFSDNNAVTAKDYLFSVLVMDDFPAFLGYKEYKSGEKVESITLQVKQGDRLVRGTKNLNSSIPTKDGYIFAGWKDEKGEIFHSKIRPDLP